MDALRTLASAAGYGSGMEGLKVAMIGNTVETAKKVGSSAWCVFRCFVAEFVLITL